MDNTRQSCPGRKSSLKLLLLFLILATSRQLVFGQTFTRITEGDIVNDNISSMASSWCDYNNDGYLDIFVTNTGGENNCLYENNGDGTFAKITRGSVTNDGGRSRSSSWGDYDNDGDMDLIVCNFEFAGANNFLYKNNGDGTFTRLMTGSIPNDGGASEACSWGDYDSDGYLDLFVANGGSDNFLYQNNGDGTFTKITTVMIVSTSGTGGSWADYDNDGDLDLLVTSNGAQNRLYQNHGDGTFAKISSGNIVNDVGHSHGASWGDYDNDGDLDLFVTNWQGENNYLYQNNGDGSFTKITSGDIPNDGGDSYGSSWGDYDNDGDLDLFVANAGSGNSFLYQNNGDGTFTKILDGIVVTESGNSLGCSSGDYDRDGDLDLFVANLSAEDNFLYRNDGNTNHWVNVLCVGTVSNRSAIGAKVRVRATIKGNSVSQMREVSGQTGFYGQNSLNAEFGLGDATVIDSIRIEWPSGIVQILTDVAVDQFLTITEQTGENPTISGEITYPGYEMNYPDGELFMNVWRNPSTWPFVDPAQAIVSTLIRRGVNFNNPVPYTIDDPNLQPGTGYFLAAFFDENGDGPPPEAEVWYANEINLSGGSQTGINISLVRPGAPAGFSFDFGATGGYAETDFQDLDGGPEITIEMFIKLHRSYGAAERFELIRKDGWAVLEYDGNTGDYTFILEGIGVIGWNHNPNPGEWHHLAVDYDGTNLTLYWDGEQKGSVATGGGDLASSSSLLRIGDGFDGLADIIRISHISLYFEGEFDPWTQDYGPDGNTFLLYHCNEGSGNQLMDDSGNDHHATITGNPTWDPDEPLAPMGPGLWFSDLGPDYVDLEWERWPAPDNEFVKYEIRRTQGATPVDIGSPVVLTETDVNVTSWQDDAVSEGTEYHYKLWMYDDVGWRFETNELTVTPGASVGFDVIVPRAADGQVYHALWSPGQDWEVDEPDFEMGPIYENFGSAEERRYYWMPGIPTGDGYTLISFLDQDGSPQSGPDSCDQDEDLVGGVFDLSIWDSEFVEIYLNECDEFGPRPQIGLNTSRLDFTQDVYTLSFQVGNEGEDTLYWEIYIEYDSTGNLDWITSIQPNKGFSIGPDEDEITVTIEPTGAQDEAEIYVDGYADADFDKWIGDKVIEVYLDAWAPPPQISGTFPSTTVAESQPITLDLQFTAITGIKKADLVYLRGGDASPKTSPFISMGGDDYQAIISAGDVTNRGLIGFARIEDNLDQVTFSDTAEIRVDFESIGMISTPSKAYIMVSVPGNLSDRNQMSVLDELGEYDKTKWRLFQWNGTDYTEFTGSARFHPTEAFWIITRDATELAAGFGVSSVLLPPYELGLNKGWNQVGNPYNFDVDLNDATYPPGFIEPTLYEYDGTGYREGTRMKPGGGYWLYAFESTVVQLRPFSSGLARQMAENAAFTWHANVEASVGNLKDSENLFGAAPSASEEWDLLDRHEPPVIGDYVTLGFDNRDWDRRGGLYSRDIRNSDAQGYEWPFVVRTNQEGYVHLDFEWTRTLPAQWEVHLVDRDLGIVEDGGQYSFASNGSEKERNFILMVGPSWYIQEAMSEYNLVPQKYALDQNIPNPFNAVTTIRFSLPEESKVSLVVYDILGQEVATLISKEPYGPGIHTVLWDGNEVSTGIYLYRLTALKEGVTQFQSARKLILLK